MAIGDVIEKTLFQSAISDTPASNYFENAGVNYSTTVSSIEFVLQSSGTTAREVYVYLKGTTADKLLLHDYVDNNIKRYGVLYEKIDVVLKSTDRMYFSQDAGTDVNVIVNGYEEQVS